MVEPTRGSISAFERISSDWFSANRAAACAAFGLAAKVSAIKLVSCGSASDSHQLTGSLSTRRSAGVTVAFGAGRLLDGGEFRELASWFRWLPCETLSPAECGAGSDRGSARGGSREAWLIDAGTASGGTASGGTASGGTASGGTASGDTASGDTAESSGNSMTLNFGLGWRSDAQPTASMKRNGPAASQEGIGRRFRPLFILAHS